MPEFDQAYYRRFYHDPATRAASPAYARRQAEFIAASARYLELPVKRVIDVGCGVGRVLKGLGRAFPKATLRGVEYSDYLCTRYGWQQGSVVTYQDKPFDLVVCNDVLAYLDDKQCNRAIDNLAALCKGMMFLGVITQEDLPVLDEERTDPDQYLRKRAWYRRRLRRHFTNIGGGLYLKKPAAVPVWALDQLDD